MMTDPAVYTPAAADSILALVRVLGDPNSVQELLQHFAQQYQRVMKARDELEADRAAFAEEKQEWYKKSAHEWDEFQQRLSRELQQHNERLAAAERDLQMRDDENKRKWNRVVKQATALGEL